MYVAQLNEATQKEIKKDLVTTLASEGLTGAELLLAVQDGMDSKLNDLADTIDISKYK